MSQNDTIELRGFDDVEKGPGGNKKKPQSSSQAKRVREWAKKKSNISEEKLEEEPQQHGENGQKPANLADTKVGEGGGETRSSAQEGGASNGPRKGEGGAFVGHRSLFLDDFVYRKVRC